MLSASSCEFIEVEMCLGLSYNLTSFPNIWLSIADQREAATLLRQYRVKAAFITYNHYLNFCCFCNNTSDASSVSPSRYWWSLHALSPCGGWCVGCFCLSAAPRVESSSPAARSAPLQSSNAAKPWISSLSAGLSIATSCQTPRIPWSARCLDASRDLMSLEVIFTPSPHYCLRMETHSALSCFPKTCGACRNFWHK